MFTIEKIMNIIEMYYIKDNRVFIKSLNEEVLDEETYLEVLAANLIFTEAESRYNEDLKLFGEKYISNPRQYLEKMMQRFSVNGEQNDLSQNVFIRALLLSNGHYEETITGAELDPKFSIFSRQKKMYGLAYLRLKLREKGMDTDDICLRIDMSESQENEPAKVIIDFNIKPFVKVVQIYGSEHPNNKDQIQESIDYPTNTELNYVYEQIFLAEKAKDVHMKKYWSKVLNMEHGGINVDYIIGQLAIARKTHNQKNINYWNDVLNAVAPIDNEVLQDKEPKALEKFEKILNGLKKEKEDASNQEEIEKVYMGVRAAIKTFDVDSLSPSWSTYSDEEKQYASTLMMKASILLDDRMRYNHWLGIFTKLNEPPKPQEEIYSLDRFEAVLYTLEQRKTKITEENKKEFENTVKKALNDYGSVFSNGQNWQKLNNQEKEWFSRLMMKAGELLDDREYMTYWAGVHSVFALEVH